MTSYIYNAAAQVTNAYFRYDTAGRMTGDGVNTYTWNRADRLLSVRGLQNQYNGLGHRVQQSVGEQERQYLLDVHPDGFKTIRTTTDHNASYYMRVSVGLHWLAD